MLRDKYIHYFQQWRERQLSRGRTLAVTASGGDEYPVAERRAEYYCGTKIWHDNAGTDIVGHQRQCFCTHCGYQADSRTRGEYSGLDRTGDF